MSGRLTPATRNAIVTLIAAGNTVEVAAAAAGVHRVSVGRWLRGDRPVEREFQREVAKARAEAEADLVAVMMKASRNGSWRAAAWLLERINPEDWAKPSERKKLRELADQEEAAKANPLAEFDELAERRKRHR